MKLEIWSNLPIVVATKLHNDTNSQGSVSMRKSIYTAITAIALTVYAGTAHGAETIYGALAKAYENNSSLNSARASVRVANESVPLAKSGYRPRVTGTAGITNNYTSSSTGANTSTLSFGITINQSIFDGFQTRNNVQSAEAQIRAERANLQIPSSTHCLMRLRHLWT